ncbi:hypothetical protein EDD15DRAFT_17408 [Pisolithus albus]|nr:hypothetical protein EDD15DRAFT_17408 [Pisolithus albus]
MHGPSSPCSGPSEASNPPQYSLKDLRSLLEDVIRVANVAKSLLRASRGLREAGNSCAQPPTASVSRSPRRTYSFCFFCGRKGHIRANCDSCKEYLAAGKCLLVKGRVVLPTGQEIPREVPGRTLKDRLDSWDLANRSKVPFRAPSTPSSSSGASLCRPRSPSHTLPTTSRGRLLSRSRSRGRGRPRSPSPLYFEDSPSRSRRYPQSYLSRPRSPEPPSRSRDLDDWRSYPRSSQPRSSTCSRDLDNLRSYSYSSRLRSPDSRDYPRDYQYYVRSPPPTPRPTYSHLPEFSRDEPDPVWPTSRLVDKTGSSTSYDTRQSHSTHVSANSRRSRSRSRTPQPSRRWY